jgi:hypothetical protein
MVEVVGLKLVTHHPVIEPVVICWWTSLRDSANSAFPIAGGHGGEFGELHCKLGHAVRIEPGLRPQSRENGNFPNVRRRLSAILPYRK